MKLKKNVALVMVAAAMLAGGYAQADNPPPTPQGDTASHRPVGGGTTEQINDLTGTGARAATITLKESLSKDGQRGGIFSKKDKEDKSRGYQKAWAQQGCTEEAWVELNNQYDKSINMSVDQSAVTDQKIMDVIQNPNQMNIKGFEMLGCDLNDTLGGLRQTIEQAQQIVQAISSGNPRDIFNKQLEDAAMGIIKGAYNQAIKTIQREGCRVFKNILKEEKERFLNDMKEFNYANNMSDQFRRNIGNIEREITNATQQTIENLGNKIGQQSQNSN